MWLIHNKEFLHLWVQPFPLLLFILKGKCCSLQEKVRLKYKVSYQVDGLPNTETGEVDSFPSAND